MKNFSSGKTAGTVAFILCVSFFIAALAGGAFTIQATTGTVDYYVSAEELLLSGSYRESTSFQREFQNRLNDIQSLLVQYRSEEAIRNGETVSEVRLEDAIRTLFYSGSYSSGYGDGYTQVITGLDAAAAYGNDYDAAPSVRERFKKDYAEEIAKIKELMIQEDLRSFRNGLRQLDQIEGLSYYASDGVNTLTNLTVSSGSAITGKQFLSAPAYLIYEGNRLTKVPASRQIPKQGMKYFDQSMLDSLNSANTEGFRIYFSFDDNFLADKEESYADARAEIFRWLPLTAVSALLSLLGLIYLIAAAGRKDEAGNRVVRPADRLFTELQLLIIGFFFFAGGAGFWALLLGSAPYGAYYNGGFYAGRGIGGVFSGIMAVLIGLVAAGAGLYFILSVVRNIKAGRFFKNSLIYIAATSLWRGVKTFYTGGSVMKKVVLLTLAVCILSATVVLAPVVGVLILIFAPKWVKKYEEIKKGVEEVKNGNLIYKISTSGDGELDRLARGINEISEASNIAIQNELKNQRLKTDLISNVSHDLKTPLTSIITYIDLLKREGLSSQDAPKYLDILDQKSIRLKKLTEDLFDAAKASSGAIPVKFEKVDLLSLINQGLGEMSDRVEASGLEFKIGAQKEKYYVRADGQLLWRVAENLISNVLKYAQEGSRVYINLREQNGKSGKAPNVILEIKNISRIELNIDADELMERFKRGDESRSTEGSGLGLAIAKDLVRLQNGWFEIKIDGDLFKTVVLLEAYPD